MHMLHLTQALGIATIYLGFSFALGYLLHTNSTGSTGRARWVGLTFTMLVFLPATAMLVGLDAWAVPARLFLCAMGWFTVGAAALQPAWIPAWFWGRSFHRTYLALAMALVTAWGLSTWLIYASSVAMLIGLAALTAGSSSAKSMLLT